MAFFYGLLEVANFIIKSALILLQTKKVAVFLLLHYLLEAFFDMMIGVQLVGLGQS